MTKRERWEPGEHRLLDARDIARLLEYFTKQGRLNIDRGRKWIAKLEKLDPGSVVRDPCTGYRKVYWQELMMSCPKFASALARTDAELCERLRDAG